MYFAKNQAGYKVECSPVAIAQWGIKRSTYKDAFNKLVELGYLEEKSKSYYIFHERAKPAEVITVEIAEKEEPCAFQFQAHRRPKINLRRNYYKGRKLTHSGLKNGQ